MPAPHFSRELAAPTLSQIHLVKRNLSIFYKIKAKNAVDHKDNLPENKYKFVVDNFLKPNLSKSELPFNSQPIS